MSHSGLDGDDAHRMGNRIVQFPGDPHPLGGHRARVSVGPFALEQPVAFLDGRPAVPPQPPVLAQQPRHRGAQRCGNPVGEPGHGRRLHRERDHEGDEGRDERDKRAMPIAVQGDREQENERVHAREGGIGEQGVAEQRRERDRECRHRQPAVDQDRQRHRAEEEVADRIDRALARDDQPGADLESQDNPEDRDNQNVDQERTQAKPGLTQFVGGEHSGHANHGAPIPRRSQVVHTQAYALRSSRGPPDGRRRAAPGPAILDGPTAAPFKEQS